MPQLCQVVAHERSLKNRVGRELTDLYHEIQRTSNTKLDGLHRVYTRRDDENGEQLPPESTRVQLRVEEALGDARARLVELFDVEATREWGNTLVKADVVVDGDVLVKDAPVGYLLFLHKQLTDIETVLRKLPTLDPAYEWQADPHDLGVSRTAPAVTFRTRKVPRNHVKAEATEKHPAQVEVYYEDTVVGEWSAVRSSGALPATRVRELTGRCEKLLKAVKYAREQANAQSVENQQVGERLLAYLLA